MNKHLGQYYTNELISRFLVSILTIQYPKNIIDIGAGEGALISAAKERWKFAEYFAFDIDPINIEKISTNAPFSKSYLINTLSDKLENEVFKGRSVDIAVCNPPFYKLKKSSYFKYLLQKTELGNIENYTIISSDLIFLAKNLLLLRKGGELAIILPDGMLTSKNFKYFREALLMNHRVKCIIQLPENAFNKTEVKTHILIIKKGYKSLNSIPIYNLTSSKSKIQKIIIEKSLLIKRMDFSFHSWIPFTGEGRTLKDLGVTIKRGIFSKKILCEKQCNFLHLKDIDSTTYQIINLSNNRYSEGIIAETNDIVVTRVGKRSIGRVAMIGHGRIQISDCIFRLQVPASYLNLVWESLNSDYARSWFNAFAHGSCSKVISMENLLEFKVYEVGSTTKG